MRVTMYYQYSFHSLLFENYYEPMKLMLILEVVENIDQLPALLEIKVWRFHVEYFYGR